jgi:hypothetical protein
MGIACDKLAGSLPEILDMAFCGSAINIVCNFVEINCSFIRQVVKKIMRRLRLRSALFEAEDKVDPAVKVLRYIFGLESEAMDAHKLVRRTLCPRR